MWSRFIWLVAITTVLVASADAQDLVSCRQTDEILAELRDLRMLVDNLVNGRTLTQRPPSDTQAQSSWRRPRNRISLLITLDSTADRPRRHQSQCNTFHRRHNLLCRDSAHGFRVRPSSAREACDHNAHSG